MFRSSGRSSAEPDPVSWRRSEVDKSTLFERCKNFPSAHCQNSNVCVPCSDEWIHAERAAHGIPDWCIGCHDQNEGSNRAHNHSGKLHGETHRSISSRAYEGTLHNRLQRHQTVQNCSKIQPLSAHLISVISLMCFVPGADAVKSRRTRSSFCDA